MDNIKTFLKGAGFRLSNQTLNESTTETERVSSGVYTLITFCMFLIFILGLLENSFSLYVFFRTKSLWTTNNIFIAGLLLSDWSQSVFGIPLVVASSVAREWLFGHGLCVYYGFITTFLGLTQITILSAISLDKYFVIVRRIQNAMLEKKKAVFIICLCYLYAFLWALAPVLGWSSYQLEAVNISCSIPWQSRAAGDVSYCLSLTVFVWILPLGAIVFSYSSICILLRKEAKKTKIGRKLKKTSRKKKQMSREKCVAITVLIMIGAFVVSWMPYSVVSLITVFGDPSAIPLSVTTVPALFAKSSIIWNPIIYVVRHNDFRRACLKFLPNCCMCKKMREYNMVNGQTTSRILTEQILLEALTRIRNSRIPRNRLLEQNTISLCSLDTTALNRNHTYKMSPLALQSRGNGSVIESEGQSGDFESCSSHNNERLNVLDKNIIDFAKTILKSFENTRDDSSFAIEHDRASVPYTENKPQVSSTNTKTSGYSSTNANRKSNEESTEIHACMTDMTDVGIQTSDSFENEPSGVEIQTSDSFDSGTYENKLQQSSRKPAKVFLIKRRSDSKNAQGLVELVQSDQMEDVILLKNDVSDGAYLYQRYYKDPRVTYNSRYTGADCSSLGYKSCETVV